MDADTGNHHDPSSYPHHVSSLPDGKIIDDRGFIRRLGGFPSHSPSLLERFRINEITFAVTTGALWGLLDSSAWLFMIPAIAVSYLKMCIDQVRMDRPASQSFHNLGVEITPHVLFIVATLMMRLVRRILLALIHLHVESLAEYISTAPIVFSVFWASRNGYGSFQMDFAVYIWFFCIDLLRGSLVSAYNDLRIFFLITIFEFLRTLAEIFGLVFYLYNLICLLLDSLIKATVNKAFNCWRSCRCLISPWVGTNVRYAALQEYKHLPLGDNRYFRLFKLSRWIPYLGVRGTLCHLSLDSISPYEAVSYHWGTVSVTRRIYVDGNPFIVSEATYDALYARSSFWRTRFIWIDYICIDQSNLLEKAGQIALMKDIYRQASLVNVWLGNASNSLDELLVNYLLQDLAHLIKKSEFSAIQLYEKFKSRRLLGLRWPAFVNFINNPWFARAWVIQEVAMADNLAIIYGSQYFDWDMFEMVAEMCCEPEMIDFLQLTQNGYGATRNLFRLRKLIRIRQARLDSDVLRLKDNYTDLLKIIAPILGNEYSEPDAVRVASTSIRNRLRLASLLSDSAGFQATDPRDKVFALLGLTTDEAQKWLIPNYSESMSTQDVYLDAARFIFAGDDPLCVLPFSGTGYNDRLAHMPSWVPDWTHQSRGNFLTYNCASKYQASGKKEPRIRVEPTSRILSLATIKVDEIAQLGPSNCHCTRDDNISIGGIGTSLESQFDGPEVLAWHRETYQLVLQGVGDVYPFKPNQTRLEAFWRTLAGDVTPAARPAPAKLGLDYHTWLEHLNDMPLLCSRAASILPVPSRQDRTLELSTWMTAMAQCAEGRRLCITNRGYMGMVPPRCEPTDVVCIILGAETPYIIRRSGDNDTSYELVGECYMHGMMDGEMMVEPVEVEQLAFV